MLEGSFPGSGADVDLPFLAPTAVYSAAQVQSIQILGVLAALAQALAWQPSHRVPHPHADTTHSRLCTVLPASQPALQSCLLNSLHVPTCWPHPVAFFSAGLLLSTLPPGVDLCGGGTVSSGVRLLQSALSLPFGCGSPGLLQSLLLQLPFQQGSATSSLLWHPRGQICSRSGSDFPSSQ